ncbi:hypothetical protein [Gordonia sp. (in: high G+C Gram-positive bacteria)]|uniref:hypothetical protein n=1 Tax=Gordonia sp. (in: high G+C Gram-positive bacteria) TaxID=84139 RepID=UPI003F979362
MTDTAGQPDAEEPDLDEAATDERAADEPADDDIGVTDEEQTPDSPAAERRWLRPALWSVAATVIVVLAGVSLFFWIEHRGSEQVNDARPAALAAARTGATAILTYHADTAQADVDATQRLLTGAFADEYRSLARTDVLPAARDRGLSSSVNISGVSLISIEKDDAEALVFVTQQVESQQQNDKPTTTATAVRVGLVRQDDRWLIEAFKPI